MTSKPTPPEPEPLAERPETSMAVPVGTATDGDAELDQVREADSLRKWLGVGALVFAAFVVSASLIALLFLNGKASALTRAVVLLAATTMFAATIRIADKLTLPFVRRLELEEKQALRPRMLQRDELDRVVKLLEQARGLFAPKGD